MPTSTMNNNNNNMVFPNFHKIHQLHVQQQHATAVNLARRYTIQNENDLMQEDIFENTMDGIPKVYDRYECEQIASHLMHYKDLPAACITNPQCSDIVYELKRRDTDTTHPTQFLS